MANDSPLHGFYNSPAWRTFSAMIRSSRFHICELCGSPDASEVHHLVHINKHNVTDPAVTLNEDNVMLLCRHCHYSIHERGKYRNRRSLFDACGNIAKVKEPHTSTLTPLQLATIRERDRAARISIAKLHQHPPYLADMTIPAETCVPRRLRVICIFSKPVGIITRIIIIT